MLISRKITQDERVLNMCIAKNNLAYLLLKDIFSLSGNSKCEVLSVLDLKDAFHSLRLTEIPRSIVEFSHILAVHHTCIREHLWI